MPLLSRMIGTPLAVDIGPGAVASLAPLLADRRISSMPLTPSSTEIQP